LRERLVDVVIATSADDACAVIHAAPAIQCLLLNWELGNDATHAQAQSVLDALLSRNATVRGRDGIDPTPVHALITRAATCASGIASGSTKVSRWITNRLPRPLTPPDHRQKRNNPLRAREPEKRENGPHCHPDGAATCRLTC